MGNGFHTRRLLTSDQLVERATRRQEAVERAAARQDANMLRWFGKPWPSIVCAECPEIPVPVGARCTHCGETIEADDTGMVYSNGPVAHRNCFLRGVIGSVAHIEKRCGCFVPGSTESDPPGLTKRQAADAAVSAWEKANRA